MVLPVKTNKWILDDLGLPGYNPLAARNPQLIDVGLFNNTLIIYILGDNGASAEGMHGTIDELLAENMLSSSAKQQIEAARRSAWVSFWAPRGTIWRATKWSSLRREVLVIASNKSFLKVFDVLKMFSWRVFCLFWALVWGNLLATSPGPLSGWKLQVLNRDFGGLDALGSKHVEPWTVKARVKKGSICHIDA